MAQIKPVALVTGSARGIGLGIAQALAESGYDLVVNNVRNQKAADQACEALKQLGADVLYCRADIANKADRLQMLDQIKSHFGRLNLLVNNAGIAPEQRADVLQATEASYDRVMDTNLKGPYFLTQEVANYFIEQRKQDPGCRAAIVNVSSISATVVSPNRGEYCLSKAGVAMATQLWAARLGEFDIPVYEIRPGLTKTDMTEKVTAKYDKLIAEGLLVQPRWGLPKDIGDAVAMLVDKGCSYCTGQVLNVDGGLTIQRL